jgi:hypothetical protein
MTLFEAEWRSEKFAPSIVMASIPMKSLNVFERVTVALVSRAFADDIPTIVLNQIQDWQLLQ